ncbi:MAG: FAD-binding protein [Myxococcales bacterium]|nr:FAD-binding protein [Myxococcales bacterium]
MARPPANWDAEYDVVAVGSGLGGLSAAIVAHDLGASCAILEKAGKLGGLSGFGGGEVFVPANEPMLALGLDDTLDEGRAYYEFIGAGYQSQPHQEKLLSTIHEAISYFGEKAGVRWKACQGLPDYYYPKAPGSKASGRYLSVDLFDGKSLGEWQGKTWLTPIMPMGALHEEMYEWGGLAKVTEWNYELLGERIAADQRSFGPGMMGFFVKAAVIDREIPAYTETPVQELVTDEDGTVVGVRAQRDGADFFVRARKGVVLAVGGYDHNKDMAKMFEEMPDWNAVFPDHLHGDHMVMGPEIGAAIASVPPQNLALFYGYQIPGEEVDGNPLWRSSWEGGCPHAIWVNKNGERFCDESFYKQYQPEIRKWDGNTQEQPNTDIYLIFDGNYREKYPLGSFMPGMPLPEEMVVTADTPRELADRLEIPAEAFEKTLQRFNANAKNHEDPDFGRGSWPWAIRLVGDPDYPNPLVGPLDKGPYHAVRLRPVSVGINSHGLQWDLDGRVQHVRGHAIPGFYAVGNSAALLDLGAGYQSGTSNSRAITWGYVAGRHAAGRS